MRAVIFDLDGTLVDTVYAHTLAWQRVLRDAGIRIEGWKALDIPKDVVVVDRSDVERAKPEPDLFLACQEKLKVRREECYVVGDAVWDRVYANPAELLGSIYQLGLRGE
jgi:beta-phosphoglucomutase-like phosphatase (HAD superfamily)